jgi:hypothetical protein
VPDAGNFHDACAPIRSLHFHSERKWQEIRFLARDDKNGNFDRVFWKSGG